MMVFTSGLINQTTLVQFQYPQLFHFFYQEVYMPVVMKDIDFNKRNKNDYENNSNEMYSLKQYTNIAKKCIS